MDLPDRELTLRDSRDFILNTSLGRKALSGGIPALPVFLSDLLEAIFRLVQVCHLPEFTDHGLPHLCSLVDRISRWELKGGNKTIVDQINPKEATTLLLAVLIHDIGMLSQNAADLPPSDDPLESKSAAVDIPTWVRQTHVARIDGLTRRLLSNSKAARVLNHKVFLTAVAIAKSHQRWPWQWGSGLSRRERALAAIVAVADLFDEDFERCDTATLLEHREGNELNRAHWLRHMLTSERLLVVGGKINVTMRRPSADQNTLQPVYSALRNHFRLVKAYEDDLKVLDADIVNILLDPATGSPTEIDTSLPDWRRLPGFPNEEAFVLQLLKSFMPEATKDYSRCDDESETRFRKCALEDVDLTLLHTARGVEEPRSTIEETFYAIIG